MTFSLGGLLGFLLVMTRVAGAFVFVPLPGFRTMPEAPRIVLILGLTLALLPFWPTVAEAPTPGALVGWLAAEAAFGVTLGVAVAFLAEGFTLAAQVFGLQAGYAYATTIDPSSQADSGVLPMVAQLVASLLFFTLGLDRQIVRVLAASLEAWPPGAFHLRPATLETVLALGGEMFRTAARLAMPVVALLVMVDLALALLGRINAQLQLLTLAFPVKMLAALALLAATAGVFPLVYGRAATCTLEGLWKALLAQ